MPFQFVDRITATDNRGWIEGEYHVPAAFESLPPWLITEAIGQLGAWLIMSHANFRVRPVAAICGEARIAGGAPRGTTLRLAVQVERLDRQAVLYHGEARLAGKPMVELRHCIGPLLPMTEFDDPAAAGRRYARLLEPAGAPDGEPDTTVVDGTVLDHEAGERLQAELVVPERAQFFDDHFPRRPVFPATLLLGCLSRLAIVLAADAVHPTPRAPLHVTRVRDVKVRSFSPPGTRLAIGAQLLSASHTRAEVVLQAKHDGRRVATARVEVARWSD